MKVSTGWIGEILKRDFDPQVAAERLTMSGTEVEEVVHHQAPDPRIVVAEVIETIPHPSPGRSELRLVKVWEGGSKVQVVCGAPNTPGKGSKVVFAGEGIEIKGRRLERREFDGVASAGMLCSEEELGIGPDETGIIVLKEEAKAGTPLGEVFGLEDWIMDLSVTPNRPDLMGHVGLAREIALLMNLPFQKPSPRENHADRGEEVSFPVEITIQDPDGCPRYTAAVLRGVRIGPSPLGMRARLHRLGARPISNAVDVTNWIMLLYNQPLHAFDLKRLAGAAIIVRKAKEKERIITLDGTLRLLGREDLVIADRSSPVAVAGVMGGEGSQIEDYTKDILIECAYFNPQSIRRTSSRLGLSSESSCRFERGIDPAGQIDALKEAVFMMCRLTGGKMVGGLVDVHPKPGRPLVVNLRESRVEKILGAKFDWEESLGIIEKLGCDVRREGGAAAVSVPPFRPDLMREIDLIEEVARVTGFDKIPSTCPVLKASRPERGSYDLVKKVRHESAAAGFTEVFNLSLVAGEKQKKYFPKILPVRIANPLSSEKDVLRVSLLPGLLENFVRALSWKEKSVRIFEVGTTFRPGEGGIVEGIVEESRVAALAFGPRPGWVGENRGEADLFDVMGLIEHLCDAVWLCEPKIERSPEGAPAFFLPSSACEVLVLGKSCGWIGDLHPEFYGELDLPRGKAGIGKVGILEIEMPLERSRERKFRPMPLYPSIERDIAMVFDESTQSGSVIEEIRKAGGSLLESARIFDIWRGSGVGQGRKSMAFSLVYRSGEATLRSEQVDEIHARIVSTLEARFGGKLR